MSAKRPKCKLIGTSRYPMSPIKYLISLASSRHHDRFMLRWTESTGITCLIWQFGFDTLHNWQRGRFSICVIFCTCGLAFLWSVIICSSSTVPIQSMNQVKYYRKTRRCSWCILKLAVSSRMHRSWLVWTWDRLISQDAFRISHSCFKISVCKL